MPRPRISTPSGMMFLRQLDAVFDYIEGLVGGGGVWGGITGTLADQTDLDTALDGKQPLDADLTTIAGLTATTDNFMQAKAGAWASRTVAQVKTDLGLTGTNSGDQTSIVGITGTKAQFDTAVTDGNFLYVGDVTAYTDEQAQDAVGAMIDASLVYVDGTPLLTRAALTGAVTATQGSNTTALGSFTKAQLDTAVSDGNVLYVGDAPTAHTHVSANVTDLATTVQAYTLDTFANPVAALDFAKQQTLQFVIENRTSDPGSPATGQMWLRTDI